MTHQRLRVLNVRTIDLQPRSERPPQHLPVDPRHTELAGCWLQVPDQYIVVLHWSARLRRLKHQIIRTLGPNDRNPSDGSSRFYFCRKTVQSSNPVDHYSIHRNRRVTGCTLWSAPVTTAEPLVNRDRVLMNVPAS